MKLIALLLVLSFGMAAGQSYDPFLRRLNKNVLQKGISQEVNLLVSGESGLARKLSAAGFRVQTDLGDKCTVRLNSADISGLSEIEGIRRLTLGPPSKLHNGPAVEYQNVEAAYLKGYSGEEVIVGVIDTGIDIYHPMFHNSNGDTRILFIWDQTISGSEPSGYDYGAEYTQNQINQDLKGFQPHSIVQHRDTEGHGTHVAGSMAGSDLSISPPDTLHGGAKEANLIIVKSTLKNNDVIDAIGYVFKKAAALNKPCVVNLSLGNQFGPHDGTDDSNRSIETMTGPGKIVVRSAGNNGGDAVHYFRDNVVSSEKIEFGYSDYMTLWLESGDNVNSVSLEWAGGSIANTFQGGHKSSSGIDLYLEAGSQSNNNKIACYVLMDDSTLSDRTFTLSLNNLSDANNNGKIERHAWAGESVFSMPYDGFSQGTSYGSPHYPYTLSNDACAKKIITVGAFITRETWVASNGNSYHYDNSGENGGIAYFSSIGPTVDERQKPDIIAGGTMVLSARSKDADFSEFFLPAAPYTQNYAYLQGTSMASPVAAGAIALIMERYPDWDPGNVLEYLSEHAQGTSLPAGISQSAVRSKIDPNTWDSVFGFGGVDLTDAFAKDPIVPKEEPLPDNFTLAQNYPNPFNPGTTIEYELSKTTDVELKIFNLLGQEVATLVDEEQAADSDPYIYYFSGSGLSSGVYFYRLQAGGVTITRKMVLMH